MHNFTVTLLIWSSITKNLPNNFSKKFSSLSQPIRIKKKLKFDIMKRLNMQALVISLFSSLRLSLFNQVWEELIWPTLIFPCLPARYSDLTQSNQPLYQSISNNILKLISIMVTIYMNFLTTIKQNTSTSNIANKSNKSIRIFWVK
jgi:NADH:ubiquinone oxidoreductase subunit 4 (subunit M)